MSLDTRGRYLTLSLKWMEKFAKSEGSLKGDFGRKQGEHKTQDGGETHKKSTQTSLKERMPKEDNDKTISGSRGTKRGSDKGKDGKIGDDKDNIDVDQDESDEADDDEGEEVDVGQEPSSNPADSHLNHNPRRSQ